MMMINPSDTFMQFGSILATIVFLKALYEQYLPYKWRDSINSFLYRYTERFVKVVNPYNHISFDEYAGGRFKRSEAYTTIETYLSERTSNKARGLKANFIKDSKSLVLGLADNEEVTDEYQGVKVWWNACKTVTRSQGIALYPGSDEKRHYKLTFHSRNRDLITESYLGHVLDQGKEIAIKKRQRKLYTNLNESPSYGKSNLWTHIEFNHPATFDTLAMEASKKELIVNDLLRFTKAKHYYKKIGKPWKRGYLLYGPPGTGKSTMVVSMANLLEYDIYDLELTAVKDNTQLRRLLIETSSKSMIVIEDIDCSLDLTGQRSTEKKQDKDGEDKEGEEGADAIKKKVKEQGETKKSEVTLSGLLNFIDGIWSACGEERVIIFTEFCAVKQSVRVMVEREHWTK
ncbi:AAA-ATPase ASD, mitochondrial-like [Chenopodium quinoa]|uniref:AAA+ ATPase domain-containing protein n=1 Tax=Chenopodium quinoa TaxID=63459 RepID=A0A803LSW5_CHEQI|nr:AAA-ATPase ASD, mitochondrial-like [Chenopodium quinoa]